MNKRLGGRWRPLFGLAAVGVLLAAACTGGDDAKDAAATPADGGQATAASARNAAGTGGQAQGTNSVQWPRPAAPPATGGIPTSLSPKPGDLLFFTNASISYNSQARHPWVVAIDAKTKKIVAAAEIGEISSSPHGIGLSADASQIYLPAGSAQPNFVATADGTRFSGGVTVVDAKTLKTVQSIATVDAPHHIQLLNDRYVLSDAWGTKQVLFMLDPADGNKIVREIAAAPFGGSPYIGFPTPDGQYVYMTVRPPADAKDHDAWISRVSVSDWTVEKVVNVGPGAVWTTFSRDGQFAYVTLGEDDFVVKVDLAQKKVVGKAATGRGPYGGVLSPDEKDLYVVSKGEGGRGQRGGTFVHIDAEAMRTVEERPSCLAFVCQADHIVVSPDGTELWVDNNMGYITVFDLKTLDFKAEITMPLLADPHGGVFVQYDKDGKGHVVMDTGGPHNGVSPYVFDNQNGVPSLAQALDKGWAPAKSSSALVLGARPAPAAAAALTATTTVNLVMQDFYYEPLASDVAVPAGKRVTFKLTNKGLAAHNIATTDFGIKPSDVAAGATAEVTALAPRAGTYKFVCTYHPGMEVPITVR